jgi:hypothetical protein
VENAHVLILNKDDNGVKFAALRQFALANSTEFSSHPTLLEQS